MKILCNGIIRKLSNTFVVQVKARDTLWPILSLYIINALAKLYRITESIAYCASYEATAYSVLLCHILPLI